MTAKPSTEPGAGADDWKTTDQTEDSSVSQLSQCLCGLVDPRRENRARARQLLRQLYPATAGRLSLLLQHEDFRVRAQVASVLGDTNDVSVVPQLLPLLQDLQWPVRACAWEALAKLDAGSHIHQATQALDDEEVLVRLAALTCLSAAGALPQEALSRLPALLQDANREIRRDALALWLRQAPSRS